MCCTVVRSLSGFQGGDELGQVLVRDPARVADLDAAELASAEQLVDLVSADVQHFRDLLDCVCLHVLTSFCRVLIVWRLLSVVTVRGGS
jgi:hypothetical protein